MHRAREGVKWGCQTLKFQRLLLYNVCNGSCAAASTSKVSWMQTWVLPYRSFHNVPCAQGQPQGIC